MCESHFAKVDNMCIECSSKILNIITIMSILLIYFLFLFLFLGFIFIFVKKIIEFKILRLSLRQANKSLYKSTEEHKKKEKNRKIAVNVRILLNYVQIISILKFIKFEWPFYFKEYFSVFAYVAYANQIFSFDCVFEDFDIKLQRFYVQSFIFNVFPFLLCLICGIVFIIFRFKDKKIKITVAILVVFTFFLPSTVSQLLEGVKCKEIDGNYYLLSNLNYKCFSEKHMEWV